MEAETVNALPHGRYPTRDGRWVAIPCTNDKIFAGLCEVTGQPELAGPDRFASIAKRETEDETVPASTT
jgi:crotonobetainyl-CoA:carnitine CoA-transferase CaiB-like acyl-CoA transferase